MTPRLESLGYVSEDGWASPALLRALCVDGGRTAQGLFRRLAGDGVSGRRETGVMNARLLIAVEFVLALTALPAGLMMIFDPLTGGSLSLDASWLEGSPFDDYLVPGLFLAGVIGLGNLTAATLLLGRWLYAGEMSLAMGVVVTTWIVVQATIIPFSAFQPVVFALGALIFVLALQERRRRVIEHFYGVGDGGSAAKPPLKAAPKA